MARSENSFSNPALLEAALEGLEIQRSRVEEQIEEVRRLLGGAPKPPGGPARNQASAAPANAPQQRSRRPLSAAARKRIALAQKKRWANYRKAEEAAKPAKSAKPAKAAPKKAAKRTSAKQAAAAAE